MTSLDPTTVLRAAGRAERRLANIRPVGGGCISETAIWQLDDGSELFLKSDVGERLPMMQAEAAGLEALSATQTIRVPEVFAVDLDHDGQHAFLASEYITTAAPQQGPAADEAFFTRFGRKLAELHRALPEEHRALPEDRRFGWTTDNFIGATVQENAVDSSWPHFFATQRLEPQIRLAQQRQLASPRLLQKVELILSQIDSLLAGGEPRPALIHGDLWRGNYLCDHDQCPVLIDPAVYRADREAEFGMLELFGSCPQPFYDAYQQTYPLLPGWRHRTQIYMLYHLLNHLNLFGGGYLSQCESLAGRII